MPQVTRKQNWDFFKSDQKNIKWHMYLKKEAYYNSEALSRSVAVLPSLSIEEQNYKAQLLLPRLMLILYKAVGHSSHWEDRLNWTVENWDAHIKSHKVQIYFFINADSEILGYSEIQVDSISFEVENMCPSDLNRKRVAYISHFGLLPQYRGGLGGQALRGVVHEISERKGVDIVKLDTSTSDQNARGKLAKVLYEFHGFQAFKMEYMNTFLNFEKQEGQAAAVKSKL